MIKRLFRSLDLFTGLGNNTAFLKLFSGRLLTNVGDSLFFIASMWLVYDLTGSAFYTGVAGFLVRGPSALSFLIGPLIDRWPIIHILVTSQFLNAVLVLVVPVAYLTGTLSVWVLFAVLPFVTFINRFVYPAQDVALPQVVADENLAEANTLLQTAGQAMDAIFNAISGVLIGLLGAVALFVVNSATFAVALLCFASMSNRALDAPDSKDPERDGSSERYLDQLLEGFEYLRGTLLVPLVASTVILNFTIGILVAALPAFAASVGGPSTYGFLMASMGAGTLAGALLASKVDSVPFGQLTSSTFIAGGIAFALALWSPWLPATFALFFLATIPIGISNVLFFTLLQSAVSTHILGRVSTLVRSAVMTAVPIGSVLGGVAATLVGTRLSLLTWSVGAILMGTYIAAHPSLRSLPEVIQIDASLLKIEDEPVTKSTTASDTARD